MGSPLADHIVDLPVGVQFTFHLKRISFRDCDPLQRIHGKFNALSIDELWNRIQQSRNSPSIAFILTNPRHMESLPALSEQLVSTEPPKKSTAHNQQATHLQVDMSGPITEHVILPSTVEAREPVLAVQIPNVASCLRDLRCQLTAKADARLRTWMSETMECIHSKALKAKAYESCADRKFRVHLELGKKCESSTMSAWLGERKTMWRGLRRLKNPEPSTSAEEVNCDTTVEADSRLQKQMSTNEGPKAKRKKPSGASADSKKKKAKCTTAARKIDSRKKKAKCTTAAARKKSIGNTKMKTSGTRTSRPQVNAARLSKRRLPTSSRKGSRTTRASGTKRKRLFVDTEERKTPRPKIRVTKASGRSTSDSARTSSRRSGGDEFDVGNCVQAWDSGLYTATVKGIEKRGRSVASVAVSSARSSSRRAALSSARSSGGGSRAGSSSRRASARNRKAPVLEDWVQCSDCSKVRASVRIPSKGTSCAASLQLRFHFTKSYPILYLVDCSISGGASSGPSTPRASRGGGTAASTRWTPRTLRATRPRRTRRSRGGTSNRARRRRRFTTSIRSTRDCRTSGDVVATVEEEEEVVRSRGSRPRRLRVA